MIAAIHITGTSFKNASGSSRQLYLSKCEPGDPVRLLREPDNAHHPYAVKVHTSIGQIGYIPRAVARVLTDADLARAWKIDTLLGGTLDKPIIGCIIAPVLPGLPDDIPGFASTPTQKA